MDYGLLGGKPNAKPNGPEGLLGTRDAANKLQAMATGNTVLVLIPLWKLTLSVSWPTTADLTTAGWRKYH